MNRLEREYANLLRVCPADDERLWIGYEQVKLRLAHNCFYTPDFCTITIAALDGSCLIEFHEVKGFMRDDAAVKLKVAAAMYPWARFYLCTKRKGEWTIDRVKTPETV